MKVTNEKTENRQVFLTVEMEPAEVDKSLEKSYHRLVQKTNIPGFRKGKAPRAVLERHIGKESLFEDALKHLIPQAYEKAIKEQNIEAIAQPHIEVSETDPLVFKAVVPLPPTIKLGDYHHIQVTPEPVKLSKDDVNQVIEQLRHQHANWEPVERPVDFNDLAVLNVESLIGDAPFINKIGLQYQVRQDLSFPMPGFAEQLLGMKVDEVKEFKLQFPSDYPDSKLAGKEASFKVTVTEIKQEQLPKLNNEFAKQVNPDFKSLDSLRKQVSTSLKLRAEERARIDFEQRLVEALVDITELEFPPIFVELEIDQLIKEQLQQWQMDDTGLEEYLRRINKTYEELREELRPLATKRVIQTLVLGKIVEEEKIDASDAEIDAEIENMMQNAAENKDKLSEFLSTPQARLSVKKMLIPRKTIQRLAEIAKSSDTSAKTTKKEAKK